MEVKANKKGLNQLAKMLVELTDQKKTKLILSQSYKARNKHRASRFTEEEFQSNINLTIAMVCNYARKKGFYDTKYIKFVFWNLLKKINLKQISKLNTDKRDGISDFTHDQYSEVYDPIYPAPYKSLAKISNEIPSALSQLERYQNLELLKSHLKARQDLFNEGIFKNQKKFQFYELFLDILNQEEVLLRETTEHRRKTAMLALLEELELFRKQNGFKSTSKLSFRKPKVLSA